MIIIFFASISNTVMVQVRLIFFKCKILIPLKYFKVNSSYLDCSKRHSCHGRLSRHHYQYPNRMHLPFHHRHDPTGQNLEPSGSYPCCLGYHPCLCQGQNHKRHRQDHYRNLVDLDSAGTGSCHKHHQDRRYRNLIGCCLRLLDSCLVRWGCRRCQCPLWKGSSNFIEIL